MTPGLHWERNMRPPPPIAVIDVGNGYRAVLVQIRLFEGAPTPANARTLLLFLRDRLPADFAVELRGRFGAPAVASHTGERMDGIWALYGSTNADIEASPAWTVSEAFLRGWANQHRIYLDWYWQHRFSELALRDPAIAEMAECFLRELLLWRRMLLWRREAVEGAGCSHGPHAELLDRAIDAQAAGARLVLRTHALARAIRRHILHGDCPRSGGLCDEDSVGQYGGEDAFRSCIHVPIDGRLRSGYGMRSSRQEPGEMRMHNGWDLYASRGTPVLAIGDGIVEHVTANGARGFARYGHVVVLKHPQWLSGEETIRSLYSHLDSQTVEPGAIVRAGQTIGTAGDTNGSLDNPGSRFARGNVHLHFEIAPRRYPMAHEARRLDPIDFFLSRGVTYDGGRASTQTTCAELEPFEALPRARAEEQPQPLVLPPHAGTSGLGLLLGAGLLAVLLFVFGGVN